jgi:branched-chain amino acid transport system permease protein
MAVLLDGVVFGLQLALLGVGMTLVFGLGGVLNLAYGQMVVVAALTAASLIELGMSPAGALPAGVLAAAGLCVAIDRSLLRGVYARTGEARVVHGLLVTLAIAFVIDGVAISSLPFSALRLRVDAAPLQVLGVPMRVGSLLASGVAALALGAVAVFLTTTRTGRQVRAVVQDETGARLCGISPRRVRTGVWALSGGLAGLVAITQSLVVSVGATVGLDLTILALIVAVVGGLGRVSGATLAGIVLGLVHAVATHLVGAFVTIVVLLAAAMLVIVLRPSGLIQGRGA